MKEDQKSKKNGEPRKRKENQSSADFLVLIKGEFFGNSKAAEFDEKKHFFAAHNNSNSTFSCF